MPQLFIGLVDCRFILLGGSNSEYCVCICVCVLWGGAGYEEDPLWEEQLSVRRNPAVNFLWGRGRIESSDETSLAIKADLVFGLILVE